LLWRAPEQRSQARAAQELPDQFGLFQGSSDRQPVIVIFNGLMRKALLLTNWIQHYMEHYYSKNFVSETTKIYYYHLL